MKFIHKEHLDQHGNGLPNVINTSGKNVPVEKISIARYKADNYKLYPIVNTSYFLLTNK